MSRLTLSDIVDLRAYENERDTLRREVIALKRTRRLSIGPVVSVVLENRTTIRFQIQEMARAERMLSDEQVQIELDTYNPLIPGPGELSMTLFIELTSEDQLREWLPNLVGIETSVLLRLGAGDGAEEIKCIVDPGHASQLTRDEITASVHYVRIALTPEQRDRFVAGVAALAIEHPNYRHETELSEETKESIRRDW
jgi:hypothetical protein